MDSYSSLAPWHSAVDKLNAAIARVLAEPQVRARLADMGTEVAASTPERLAEFIAIQVDRWSKVITPGMRID